MKKFTLFPVIFILFAPIIYASAEENFFFSLGGIYAIEDFNFDVVEDMELDSDFDDGMGVNAKIGYFLTDYFAFGIDFDILRGFEWDKSENFSATYYDLYSDTDRYAVLQGTVGVDAEINFLTGIGFARLSLPGKFRPYISAGFGIIRQDYDIELSASIRDEKIGDYAVSDSDHDTDENLCGKCGIGFEFRPIDRASVGIEGCYTAGFGDMDDIKYTTITLGASIYF
jgi:opacity protein-like surface antigen